MYLSSADLPAIHTPSLMKDMTQLDNEIRNPFRVGISE